MMPTYPAAPRGATGGATGGSGHYVLAGKLLVLMALQAAAMHTYAALAPFIRTDLALRPSALGLVAAAPYLGTVLAAFGLGGWVDRRPPQRVALVAGFWVALALAVVAVSNWLAVVALGFLMIGLGRAAIPPLTDRLGYELVPVHTRGFVFGIKQTGTPLGSILASILLPPVAATIAGWRGAVAGTALAVGVISMLVARTLAPRRRDRASHDASTGGAARREPSRVVVRRLVRGLVGPIVFSFSLGIFMAGAMTFLTLFLVDTAGLDPVRAARWFALFGIGGAAGRVAWGWLSDRMFAGQRSYVLALTAVLGGLTAVGIGLAPALLSGVLGAVVVGLFGFLAQGWVGIVRALGAEIAGPGYSGRAGGLLLGSMMLGGLIGPPIFGWLVERSGDYVVAWSAVGTIAIAGGLLVVPTARRERAITTLPSPDPNPSSDREGDL